MYTHEYQAIGTYESKTNKKNIFQNVDRVSLKNEI